MVEHFKQEILMVKRGTHYCKVVIQDAVFVLQNNSYLG